MLWSVWTCGEASLGLGGGLVGPVGRESVAAGGEVSAVATGARADAVELVARVRPGQRGRSGRRGLPSARAPARRSASPPGPRRASSTSRRDSLAALLGRLPAAAAPCGTRTGPVPVRARRAARARLPSAPRLVVLERGGAHLLGQDRQPGDVAGEHLGAALAGEREQRRRPGLGPARRPPRREPLIEPRSPHGRAARSRSTGRRPSRLRPPRPTPRRAAWRPMPRAAGRSGTAARPARPAPARCGAAREPAAAIGSAVAWPDRSDRRRATRASRSSGGSGAFSSLLSVRTARAASRRRARARGRARVRLSNKRRRRFKRLS